jgi:hypothetical protein
MDDPRKPSYRAIGTDVGTERREAMGIGAGTRITPYSSQSTALGTDAEVGTGCVGAPRIKRITRSTA